MADPKQELARSETIRVDGRKLAGLFPAPMNELGPKRGYMQSLDLIWTVGKNHPVWGKLDAVEAGALEGTVVYAQERAKVQHFYAQIGLDFGVHASHQSGNLVAGRQGGSSMVNWSKVPRHQLRSKCLKSAFHEYAHALQDWRIGAHQGNDYGWSKSEQDYADSLAAMQRKYRALGKTDQEAYLATPREVDARALADAALVQIAEDIDSDTWDFVLPLTLFKAYAEEP